MTIAKLSAKLSAKLESLLQQFLNLRRAHFGATSEKFTPQAELFTEKVELPVPPEPEKLSVPAHQRKKGRPALPTIFRTYGATTI